MYMLDVLPHQEARRTDSVLTTADDKIEEAVSGPQGRS